MIFFSYHKYTSQIYLGNIKQNNRFARVFAKLFQRRHLKKKDFYFVTYF